MNKFFKQYVDLFVIFFIDDILIYSRSEEEHASHLRVVMNTLKNCQLFAKINKHELCLRFFSFLCHIVSSKGIRVDSQKTKEWNNGPDLPLQHSDDCEKSFAELKTRLTTSHVLTLPEGLDGYVIYCDVSRVGLGCVLMQRDKIISCASRKLKVHEKNYPTHEIDLAVVVFAL